MSTPLRRRRSEAPPTLFDRVACAFGGALIGAIAGLLFGLPIVFVLHQFGVAAANDVSFVFLPTTLATAGALAGFILVERGGDLLGDLLAKAMATFFHS